MFIRVFLGGIFILCLSVIALRRLWAGLSSLGNTPPQVKTPWRQEEFIPAALPVPACFVLLVRVCVCFIFTSSTHRMAPHDDDAPASGSRPLKSDAEQTEASRLRPGRIQARDGESAVMTAAQNDWAIFYFFFVILKQI